MASWFVRKSSKDIRRQLCLGWELEDPAVQTREAFSLSKYNLISFLFQSFCTQSSSPLSLFEIRGSTILGLVVNWREVKVRTG